MPRALHAVASRYERADGASPRRRTGEPHADILGFAAIVGFCCFRRRRAGRRGAKRGQAVCEITGLRFAAEAAGMETSRAGDVPRRGREVGTQRFVGPWGCDSRRRSQGWRCPVPEMSRDAGAKWEPSGLWGLGVAIRGGGRRSGDIPWRRMSRDAGAKRRCPVAEMSRDAARSGNPAVCGALGLRFVAEARDGDALWRRMSRGAGAKWRCPVAEMSRDAARSGNPAVCGALGLRFAAEARDGRCFGAGIDRLRPVGAR